MFSIQLNRPHFSNSIYHSTKKSLLTKLLQATMVTRIMKCCARLNNAGTEQLANGLFADAADSFTGSLCLVKSALALLANKVAKMNGEHEQCYQRSCLNQVTALSVHHHQALSEERQGQLLISGQGLYLFPLLLSEDADFELYSPVVEASVAIMFNLALSHHLGALCGENNNDNVRQSKLDQAVALYELAYTVEMQEEADLSVEFTMGIINNLGHLHRVMGNHEKSQQCFKHLLSTILFLQSSGQTRCRTEEFVQSVMHLILRETVAAAA